MPLDDSDWLDLIVAHRSSLDERIDVVTAIRHIGGAMGAPWLSRANDGRLYAVKFQQSGNHALTRSFICEQVVSRLGALIGAPVPEVVVANCPPAVVSLTQGFGPRCEGACHASLYLGDGAVDEKPPQPPRSDLDRIGYAKLSLLYGWFSVSSDHQVIRMPPTAVSFAGTVVSVDHGLFLPSGANWTVLDLENEPPPTPDSVFVLPDAATLAETRMKIRAVTDSDIARALAHVDTAWNASDAELVSLGKYLSSRRGVI